jgi:tryptophan synthase alpha chain
MSKTANNRIVTAFSQLQAEGRKTVLPFITAGYPNLGLTVELLHDFQRRGVRVCELGIPYSDPIADGATIQASYTAALDGGVTLEKIANAVADFRQSGGTMGLVAMLSYSIVYRHGADAFCTQAADAGFDGLIVPDLPLGEAGDFEQLASTAGLCNIMLTAPTTPQSRRVEIARHSRGFLYYMSVAGITGQRTTLPQDTVENVRALREQIDLPVCVGFGISSGQMVAEVCKAADGAIVGSAIVQRITDAINQNAGEEDIVRCAGEFVDSLLTPLE